MVNSLRPSSTRSPTRRASRNPTPPPSHLSSTSSQQLDNEHEANRPSKRIKLTFKGSRSSPAVSEGPHDTTASIPSPRPPVKLTIAEPHGDLLSTTNGVRKSLKITGDALHLDVSSASTPDPSHPSSQRETRRTSDRRSLRSQDEGPRIKSELAVYFPNYEEIIYDAPKEPEFLTAETTIYISDEPYTSPTNTTSRQGPVAASSNGRNNYTSASPRKTIPSPSKHKTKYNGAQVIDFSSIEKSVGHHPRDPLTDAYYFKSHRRAERKEKQLRNIEKERAMHEKAQLERLLEALEGHDWLRVMGINSVSDADGKKYGPKRQYFIDEVNALLYKFKSWKDEERRIRLEKEAAAMADEDEEDEDEEDDESEGEPSSSDLDASAARQLQIEATSGGKGGKGAKGGKSKGKQRIAVPATISAPAPPPPPPAPVIYRPPTPEGPFVSFYSKQHLRAAALGKSRHGRTATAFGQAIPEPEEADFALPEDYVTPDALRDNARKRRRMKRESAVDTTTKK